MFSFSLQIREKLFIHMDMNDLTQTDKEIWSQKDAKQYLLQLSLKDEIRCMHTKHGLCSKKKGWTLLKLGRRPTKKKMSNQNSFETKYIHFQLLRRRKASFESKVAFI